MAETLNVSAIDKSIQIEDYLYEKFNCLLELRPSLPPEFQHSLFDSVNIYKKYCEILLFFR